MMSNDDLHLSKISQQFDYSMQNINNPLSQNDDNCMELLDKITFDDNTSNFMPSSSNSNIYVQNNVEVKDDDKYCQEIMSALEKKDFSRILSLAISQSQSGHKMTCLLNETIQEIEKSSNKQVDPKIIEKLHSLLRSQPKAIAATPLRATVAPIRNESIVCSSSSNMSNNVGFRPNKSVKSEVLQDDFMSLISSDCKLPSGTRSLPATPPISQVPNRPLSSHCVPIRSHEQRKQRSDCDIEQQQQHQLPFCSYGNQQPQQQQQQQQQQPMQYLPLNMSQFAPYPQSLMAPNIVIMPMMNSPADQQGTVTHSLPQSSPVQSQAGQSGSQNNQISLLLSSAAFFSMANTAANQTVTTSHDSGAGGGLNGLSGLGNCTSTTPAVRSPALMPSHGSNLPKLLPKPQQPIIMPRTMQFPATMQHHHPVQQQQQIQHQSLQQQHHQQQQQQFKRPTNRKTTVKSRSSSRSSKSAAATAKKESNKDNVAVAWEIAEQSGVGEETQASFVTELTSGAGGGAGADEFCLLPPGSDALGALFCSGGGGDSQQTHEFDELLEELVTMSYGVVRNARIEVQETTFESCLARVEPVRYHRASVMVGGSVITGAVASQRPMVASHSVVVVRQLPLADLSMSVGAVRSSVDSQRVMQLLCAHLGRHSATLLSPLLKCLLPTGGTVTNDTGGPLSVCTRLSEQDELTEDDLLADISPVKRDPAQLANLDRFLESCQSITPCSSLQDYEDEPQLLLSSSLFTGGNDMDDEMIEQQHIHHHHPHHNHHNGNKMLLPFQARSQEEHLTLQDFCGDRSASWLRKSKQRSKWSLNGTVVRCSKALEVPPQLSACGNNGVSGTGQMGDHRRERQLVLRKKSTFKQLGKRPLRRKVVDAAKKSLKYIGAMANKSQKVHDIPNATTTPIIMDTPVIHHDAEEEDTNTASSGCLKVRIRLSQLRVVASTIVRSLEPPLPPPPLMVNNSSGGASSSSSRRRGGTISTGLTTKRIFCTRKEDRRSSALNVGIITSGVGTSGSSASPNKQHRKQHSQQQPQLQQHSPCKSKRGKKVEQPQQLQQQQTASTPLLPSPPHVQQAPIQHPPLILKLSTLKRTPAEPTPQSITSSGSLKLRLKRSQDCAYAQQQQMAPQVECNEIVANNNCNSGHSYEFNPTVTLAPPPVHHRPRMQLAAALQFSPAHSSSDSDVDGAHNEISSLLQRQEAAAAAVIAAGGGGPAGGGNGGCNGGPAVSSDSNHHHHNASAAATAANNSFPQLIPVPYLVGSDPTVFIDPHECDLVVVKNSRYKKVSQRGSGGTGDHHSMSGAVGGGTAIAGTEMMEGGQPLSLQPDGATSTALSATDGNNTNNSNNNGSGGGLNNANELLFVPGCFIEQQHDKGTHHLPSAWNHSSPSMPVLAPQEPFATGGGGSGADVGKSSHLAASYDYGNQSQLGQSSQSYIEASSERLQQSPLCMTANAVSQHNNSSTNNKHSNSNNHHNDMRQQDRTTKSPYQQHHPLYYQQQQSYSGPCYLTDNSAVASSAADQSRSSKSQSYSSPVAANLQTSSCSSHIPDYSLYFQNASQIQSLASSDNAASFSSISLSSSLYPQPVPSADQHQQQHHHQSHQHQQHHHQSHQHQHHSQQQQHHQSSSSSKHTHSKRPSSSRSHASEHGQQQQSSGSSVVAPKKRKEPSQPVPPSASLQLPGYAYNSAAAAADLYSSAAAAQYSNFDYCSGGFSEIMSNLDPSKIYEHWSRSSQLGQLYPGTLPWMAEYCKQAATLMPSGISASNALSLTAANLHGGGVSGGGGGGGTDYSTDLSHSSVDSLKPPPPSSIGYLDQYTAYAMAQPYMYPAFSMPK